MDCLALFLHRLTILVVSCQSLFTHPRPQSPSLFLNRYKLSRVAVVTRMMFNQQHNIAWNQALLRGKMVKNGGKQDKNSASEASRTVVWGGGKGGVLAPP